MGDVLAGDTAPVEGTHGQLGARLADRLGGDDAHGVAQLGQFAGCQVAPITEGADTDLGFALEHRAHRDDKAFLFPMDLVDLPDEAGRQLLILLGYDGRLALAGQIQGQHAPEQVIVDSGGLVFSVLEAQRYFQVFPGAAVLFADDDILGHVHQSPGQVTGVGRPQGGIRESLAGTVGGDEELEHAHALHQARLDRALHGLTLRIQHQTPHAGQLVHLVGITTGAGIGHHVERVELIEVLVHGLGHLVGRLVPLLHDQLVPLAFGDEAAIVLRIYLSDLALIVIEDLTLLRRDNDVVFADRHAGVGGIPETEGLDHVQHLRHCYGAVLVDQVGDQAVHLLLVDGEVDESPAGEVVVFTDVVG